ncbi:hypothetical protein HMPREF9413_2554 [Paenibacillus sp. HGF7]|nr:hypothetical protein HMPREF9413_2554 [Paenibacillus sp. HGF7]
MPNILLSRLPSLQGYSRADILKCTRNKNLAPERQKDGCLALRETQRDT